MKKFSIAAMLATASTAAILGLAAPANADLGHHQWVTDMQQTVSAPKVDTTLHN